MNAKESRIAVSGEAGEFPPAGIDLALVVCKDGSIATVLQAPALADAGQELRAGLRVSELWPAAVVERLLQLVRGTIRSRELHCECISTGNSDIEFTLIAQGRDRVLVLVRDVSERVLALTRIQRMAYLDDVTQLPNRKFLRKELDTILDTVRLTEGRVALVYIDVDSVVSRSMFYHPQRQEILVREIASRLKQVLRGVNDELPIDYERYTAAARIDFSQFAVILPGIDGGDAAEAVAKRLIDTLGQPILFNEREIRVSVSAGIAMTPQDGVDSDSLMEKAAAAMDVARGSQSDNCRFYSGTAKLPALQRKDMELELQAALDRQEFELNYLPILAAGNGNVVALEALLRWPKTLFEARSIAQVVSLAEHTGLILPIGDWVLRRACQALRVLRESRYPKLQLAVNLTLQEFSRTDLVEHIAAILDSYALPPSALHFEINEHLVFRDAMCEYPVSKALRSLGVGLTIDDFGTGACSLAHLAHCPASAVKIENSIVSNVDNPRNRAACRAAIAMAKELGVAVIAEGVETEEQAAFMREAGCDQVQGFLYGRPRHEDDLVSALASFANRAKER